MGATFLLLQQIARQRTEEAERQREQNKRREARTKYSNALAGIAYYQPLGTALPWPIDLGTAVPGPLFVEEAEKPKKEEEPVLNAALLDLLF